MTLYRCFAWDERATVTNPGGALWIPQSWQGDGRHDNPDRFGCLYLSERELSAVVEQFARFRGGPLIPALLRRRGLPLAVAALEVDEGIRLIDLDDPRVLARERLRPSQVATRQRAITQAQARALHERRAEADGLRWWSTFESSWMNVTLFHRATPRLRLGSVHALTIDSPIISEASEFLGMPRLRRGDW